MGQMILCTAPLAEKPYYIENSSLHVYSLEEVCYDLIHGAQMTGKDLMCREFCEWVREELKKVELAESLLACLEKESSVCAFVEMLFADTGYATKEEKGRVLESLAQLEEKDEFEQGKLSADRLLKKKRYRAAAAEYGRILKNVKEDTSLKLIGNVYHNLGVSCVGMFLFSQAADFFESAYEKNQNPESLKEEFFCLWLSKEEEKLERLAEKHGIEAVMLKSCEQELREAEKRAASDAVSKKIQKLHEDYGEDPYGDVQREIQNMMEKWKQEYKEYGR